MLAGPEVCPMRPALFLSLALALACSKDDDGDDDEDDSGTGSDGASGGEEPPSWWNSYEDIDPGTNATPEGKVYSDPDGCMWWDSDSDMVRWKGVDYVASPSSPLGPGSDYVDEEPPDALLVYRAEAVDLEIEGELEGIWGIWPKGEAEVGEHSVWLGELGVILCQDPNPDPLSPEHCGEPVILSYGCD